MSSHPVHTMPEVAPGIPAEFPEHPKAWLGFKVRRTCKRRGGHWWHSSDGWIENRCCQCGATRDGYPKDGT